jgi:ABC-2 type transport system ATP-binding protein
MISVHDLWKTFRHHNAVRGLSFSVSEGSAYALIGANGAGKTTTLKILMNILQPTRGRASVLGVDSSRLSLAELNQIGYVSENQELPERLTVAEYFDYLRPFYSTWDNSLEQSLRSQLALPANRKIVALSHGMRMKMALACALPFRPRLLILDEPFSGLDPLVRDEFMDSLVGQAGEMTILISSHELGEIEGFATHVAFLEDGRLLFDEPMTDLTARFRQIRVTLDHPAEIPEELPSNWLHFQATGNVVEFVETRFTEEWNAHLQLFFRGIRAIDADPMPLRSIFTSLARAARAAAAANSEAA